MLYPLQSPPGTRRVTVTVAALLLGVTALHYLTPTSLPLLHDVYRRLYYIPVALAAVWLGLRGGLAVSAAVAVAYLPHIFLHWHHVGREIWNQVMEIALYFAFSGTVGYFAEQERVFRSRWQEAAEKLERSYADLRRKADEALVIEGQLRRADRLAAMGELAAGMTHEIRNPLGAVRGAAEILRDEFPEGHPKAEFAEMLLRETDRLDAVVERFLGFARSRGGEEGTDLVDLAALLRETGDLVAAQARKAGARLSLPEPPGPLARGSAPQLKQVLLNLLLNAIQASAPGASVRAHFELRDAPAGEFRAPAGRVAALLVEDEGPGMDAETLGRAFEPFFTTKAEGTGLGLAISQRIAQAHGGELRAENRPEGGARFTLTLPLAEEPGGDRG